MTELMDGQTTGQRPTDEKSVGQRPDGRREAEKAAYWQRRELLTLADALQGEFEGTLANVTQRGDELSNASERIAQAIGRVKDLTQQLTFNAGSASDNVNAVAAATEELAGSAGVIDEQVSRTSEQAKTAVGETEQASDIIQSLAKASERIGDIVKLIQDIANQTNLLALNATIEAARAGDAGKGFAVVAGEVKSLAGQTADATKDISTQIQEIQQVADKVVDAIERIKSSISEVENFSDEATGAVQQQKEAISEIGRNAQEAAISTSALSEAVTGVANEIEGTTGLIDEQSGKSQDVNRMVQDLKGRLATAIQTTKDRDYAKVEVLPVELLAYWKGEDGSEADCYLAELDRDGANLRVDGETAPQGAGRLDIPALGVIDARVEGTRAVFAEGGKAAVDAFLDLHAAMDQPFVAICTRTAQAISKRFDAAVASGEISKEDLFDRDYKPVDGSNPQQHLTRYIEFTDRVLPEFQEPVLDFDERVAFCAAVDENGYLPTHNNKYSHPQRPDDPVWNAGNCRNRRIFTDRTGQAAGANRLPFLIQSYIRDMGGGNFVLMKDLTVPITVQGKQWGNLRLGYKP